MHSSRDTESKAPYTKIDDKRPLAYSRYDDRDIDNTEKCEEATKKALINCCTELCLGCDKCTTAIGRVITSCCKEICLCCEKCMRAIKMCCENFAEKAAAVLQEGYPLIVRPVGSAVGGFFTAPSGEVRLYQPVIDVAMLPVNSAVVTVEFMNFLRANGECGFPRVSAPMWGRMFNFGQLITDSCNSGFTNSDRALRPLAGVTAATLACYSGLLLMEIMDGLMQHNISQSFSFSPVKMVENMMHNDHTGFQIFVLALSAYIGATNGFLKGKDLVLHEISDWLHHLRADIKTDALQRHLLNLEKITDRKTADRVINDYEKAVAAGKDWKVIDVTGRVLQRLLLIPSSILKIGNTNTQKVTQVKSWLKNNKSLEESKSKAQSSLLTRADAGNSCAIAVSKCLGWENSRKANAKANYVDYDLMLETKKSEYGRLTSMFQSVVGYVSRDKKNDGRERNLNADLQNRFIADKLRAELGQPISAPILPSEAPPPYNPNWTDEAKDNEHIQNMLQGKFPNNEASFNEKAKLYQKAVYYVYRGDKDAVDGLWKDNCPTYTDALKDNIVGIPGNNSEHKQDNKDKEASLNIASAPDLSQKSAGMSGPGSNV